MQDNENISLLIIDESPADAKLLQLMLDKTINQISIESNTSNVTKLLSYKHFDAILLNIGTYNPNRLALLQECITHSDAFIIAIADLEDKQLALDTYLLGAHEVLVRGLFSSEELKTKMEIGLIKHQSEKEYLWLQRVGNITSWVYATSTGQVNIFDKASKDCYLNIDLEQRQVLFFKIKEEVEAILSGSHWQSETTIKIPKDKSQNGDERFFSLQIEAFSTKTIPSHIRGIIQDITQRKSANKALERTHRKYMDIFANSSDGIYVSSTLGQLTECNAAGLEIFGIKQQEIQTTNIHHFFQGKEIDDILMDIGYRNSVKNREFKIEQKNGSIRNCLISVVYFEDEEDTYTGILRDITERKVAEKIRRTQMLEKESNELKEQFIAAISHEMRTPMNAIVGLSNLLLDTKMNEEQVSYLKSIHYSSEQLLGILNDILDISSLKNGKIKFEAKDFDLEDLLTNLLHNLSYKVVDKDVKLTLGIDSEIPKILIGDKLRINQVLYNLAGNAVKFTDKGEVKITCTLLGQSGNTVLIKFGISDTGIGIPKEKQDAIFESFTRIKHKERIFEGTGLGLAISKNLIEQQGGKIWVTSKPGKGSTFYFDMVLEIGKNQQLHSRNTNEKTVLHITNPKKILIVEDNKMNQLVARKLLAKRWPELDILIANNGQEAVDLVSEDIDVILMDLHMPVLDGYGATKVIRENPNPRINSLPILAMTADAQIQDGTKIKTHKLDGYIVKPFDPGILYEKILLQLNDSND